MIGGGGEDVTDSVDRAVGRLEARIVELERRLVAAETAKHTCTGDSCHVVDDRIETLRAEIEALRAVTETAKREPVEPTRAPSTPRVERCPECDARFTLPAGVGGGDLVRCGRCRGEWEVSA